MWGITRRMFSVGDYFDVKSSKSFDFICFLLVFALSLQRLFDWLDGFNSANTLPRGKTPVPFRQALSSEKPPVY